MSTREALSRIAVALERLADLFCPQGPQPGLAELHDKMDRFLASASARSNGQPHEPQDGNRKAADRDFYTTQQAREATGWSRYSFAERCNRGIIHAEKRNGTWWIARNEVERIKREGLPQMPSTGRSRRRP